jgi:hypothetical protein
LSIYYVFYGTTTATETTKAAAANPMVTGFAEAANVLWT